MKASSKEATKAGEAKYFTGKPCSRGHLAHRHTRNRGCVECEALRATGDKQIYRREMRTRNPVLVLFKNAKARAKLRDIPFEIAIKDIVWTDACPCCGHPFVLGSPVKRPVPLTPSLDRKVPEKGYVPGNIVVLCHRCNTLKRDASVAEIETLLTWMRTI